MTNLSGGEVNYNKLLMFLWYAHTMPNFAQVIEEAVSATRNIARSRSSHCSVMQQLCNREMGLFKEGELQSISDFLSKKGFKDFEYLGSGSNAALVAPLDNKNLGTVS